MFTDTMNQVHKLCGVCETQYKRIELTTQIFLSNNLNLKLKNVFYSIILFYYFILLFYSIIFILF